MKINFLFSLHVELTSSFSSVLQESYPILTHCMLMLLGTLPYLLLAMISLQNHLNYRCDQTECWKQLKSFYLEVQHTIHSDYHCLLVGTWSSSLSSVTAIVGCFICSVSSFSQFKNEMQKYYKSVASLYLNNMGKVSKIYSFLNFSFLCYKGCKINLYNPRKVREWFCE